MARRKVRTAGPSKGGPGGGRPRTAGSPATGSEAALREAWQLFGAGRLGEAHALCRRLLAQRPEDAEALHLLGVIAFQAGQLADAAGFIDRALAKAPRNADFLVNRGAVHLAAAEGNEAIACFRRALEVQPGHGNAHLRLGRALLGADRPEEAIDHLRKAVRLMPKYAPAHAHLGAALARHEGPEVGLRSLRKASALAPNDPRVRENLGTALLDSGDAEGALAEFEAAAALAPRVATVHFGRARALDRLGRSRLSVAAYRRAVELDDTFAAAHNNLARLLAARQHHDEAVAHFRKAVALWPKEREFRRNLANALATIGEMEEAASFLQALEREFPEATDIYVQHARMLQEDGQFERAREVLDVVRARNGDPREYFATVVADRAMDVRKDEEARVVAAIDDKTTPLETAVSLCFAMGHLMERRKAYDEAFEYFRRGNEFRNGTSRYDPEAEHRHTDRLIATFDADFFASHREAGVADERPLFVVGMPRSGTSLIEQIVASHRGAAGAGELDAFDLLAGELPDMLNTAEPYPDCARRLDPQKLASLGNGYLQRLSARFPDARRITDKMPDNFMHLGLIAQVFPRARVLHCVRDPMDTCFSIFTHNFAGRHDYAYAQENIAHFFAQYRRLMAHWRAVLPIPMLDVDYEALVAEPEPRIREMIDFCGLEWDDDCLQFHEARRAVRTASVWQVRQPIYRSSVERWRHFESHLGPLRDALAATAPADPGPT